MSRRRTALVAIALAALPAASLAAPPGDDPGGPGPDPSAASTAACLRDARATLTADAPEIALGAETRVRWSATLPPACEEAGARLRLGSGQVVGLQGETPVRPMSSTSYSLRLEATGGASAVLGRAAVAVRLPAVVDIAEGSPPWQALMVQALGTPGTLVRIAPGVRMDLTGRERIMIAERVTLTGDPLVRPVATGPGGPVTAPLPLLADPGAPAPLAPPVRRSATSPGPLLFTRSRPRPLLEIAGDDVRITGLRLHGPTWGSGEGDDNLENGILVSGRVRVEIADLEVAGWSGQGIRVNDKEGRILGPQDVDIHDNVFHHNQHIGGNGYGVLTSAGAYATIRRNVFDLNRHAIASSGKAGTGYRAEHNLVLRGGGVHGKWYNSFTHQFDVHGDANCPDIPGNRHTWNCGNAGDQYWMQGNAFQYVSDDAIKLRGTPRVAAYIDGNVFAHRSVSDAVELRSRTRVSLDGPGRPASVARADGYGASGTCDIDGDRRDDLVLPTGVSWWYSSGGAGRWSFLRAAPGRIGDLVLGDVDADGRCDVLADGPGGVVMSSGGTADQRPVPGLEGARVAEIRVADLTGDGVDDVFRRAPDGGWWLIRPGAAPEALQSSSAPLSALRLGDFDGDGRADVLGVSGGRWAVSWGGRSTWQRLNARIGGGQERALIADVDGNGIDDVVRLNIRNLTRADVEWSKDGRTPWRTLRRAEMPRTGPGVNTLAVTWPWIQAGRFDADPGEEVLLAGPDRMARILDATGIAAAPHNRMPY
ncbi:MAG: hypothetical protein MUE51_11495 [Thermoleophilia bacterium]|nr:hypothetical protein [Thermoleophilia bacterium]